MSAEKNGQLEEKRPHVSTVAEAIPQTGQKLSKWVRSKNMVLQSSRHRSINVLAIGKPLLSSRLIVVESRLKVRSFKGNGPPSATFIFDQLQAIVPGRVQDPRRANLGGPFAEIERRRVAKGVVTAVSSINWRE